MKVSELRNKDISELNKGFYIINLSYDNISQTNLPIIITH